MRIATLLLFAPLLSAASADLRIDHVSISGRSLAALEKQLETTGLKIEPGGKHTNRATEMAIASFSDGSYLELIARQDPFDAAMLARHPWAKFIEGDAGPTAWAVRPKDFAGEAARLKLGTEPGGRQRPDGFALQWETAGAGAHGIFLPFLIRDITPREKRAFPSGKAANRDFSGVARVVIAVTNIKDAVERFNAAYPSGHPLKTIDTDFGAALAWLPDTPVVFAQPLGSSSWVAARIERFGEGPCAYILGAKKDLNREWKLRSNWFGRQVKWFDPEKLGGWWLGVQTEGL